MQVEKAFTSCPVGGWCLAWVWRPLVVAVAYTDLKQYTSGMEAYFGIISTSVISIPNPVPIKWLTAKKEEGTSLALAGLGDISLIVRTVRIRYMFLSEWTLLHVLTLVPPVKNFIFLSLGHLFPLPGSNSKSLVNLWEDRIHGKHRMKWWRYAKLCHRG